MSAGASLPEQRRTLPVWGFALVVIVYLAIIQLGGRLASRAFDAAGEDLLSTRDVLVSMCIPLGAALVFTYAVVAALGWRRPVLEDDRPVRRWVLVVPVVLLVSAVVAIDYADLADKDVSYVLALLLATQLVGWGEEGMFRGIGVTAMRDRGLTEAKVALWSSVVFGAVHLSNALGTGVKALPQAIVVSLAGYFFYLTRRASGGNALNSVTHGLFDFSLLSASVVLADQVGYVGSFAVILAYPVLGIVLFLRRHQIEPEAAHIRRPAAP
jgi:hypothetical protein